MRWTEEEALKHGYKQDKNGEWYIPSPASSSSPLAQAKTNQAAITAAIDIRVRDSRQMPVSKRGNKDASRGILKTGKKRASKSRKSLSRENEAGKRWRIRITNFRVADFDSDNIYAKWYVDELSKRGVIPDDSSKYVDCTSKWVVPVTTKEEERTLVEVYEYAYCE